MKTAKVQDILLDVLNTSAATIVRMYGFDGLLSALKPSPSLDERIEKLDQIQADLLAASQAVADLRANASESKREAEALTATVARLQEEKRVAEEIIKLPEEAVANIISRANAKGRGRGLVEGLIVGFGTGLASSLLVWYLTS